LHVGAGRVAPYDGDLDDYARLILRGDPVALAQAPASTGNRRDERRARADARARLVPLRQQLARIEQRMVEAEKRKHAADAALTDPELYDGSHAQRLAELTLRAGTLAAELSQLENEWLRAHAELEQASTA
jgi:ATP-binding cassette subfamily F protein 3